MRKTPANDNHPPMQHQMDALQRRMISLEQRATVLTDCLLEAATAWAGQRSAMLELKARCADLIRRVS